MKGSYTTIEASVHYPTDYGFISGVKKVDGDATDVLMLVEEPTLPGCQVRVRPIDVLLVRD